MKSYKNIFFGTPDISVYFLEKLKSLGFTFDLIITKPDRPFGRKKNINSSTSKNLSKEK